MTLSGVLTLRLATYIDTHTGSNLGCNVLLKDTPKCGEEKEECMCSLPVLADVLALTPEPQPPKIFVKLLFVNFSFRGCLLMSPLDTTVSFTHLQ